jgi:hypothetical protein
MFTMNEVQYGIPSINEVFYILDLFYANIHRNYKKM